MTGPIPTASIYGPFHAVSRECQLIADYLNERFRVEHDDANATEAGLPSWHRAVVPGEGRAARIELCVDWETALVVLVDVEVGLDEVWRHQEDDVECRIAYPGHGLRTSELNELRTLLKALEGGAEKRRFLLVSQERPLEQCANRPLKGVVVVLPVGGGDDEVRSAGVGNKHLEDLAVRRDR